VQQKINKQTNKQTKTNMTNYDMTNQIEVISVSSTGASLLKNLYLETK